MRNARKQKNSAYSKLGVHANHAGTREATSFLGGSRDLRG